MEAEDRCVSVVTQKKLDQVKILLEGSGPASTGWWAMYCPYHGDSRRSAGLNVDDGHFVCHGCGENKDIDQVIADHETWVVRVPGLKVNGSALKTVISEAMIDGWHSGLLSNSKRLDALRVARGLNMKTIMKYELGWDSSKNSYTIPIRDRNGEILNIRSYQLDVPEGRRKMWSVAGHGTPVLWPMDQLDYVALVICEGEMDAMLTIQNGIPAITRTGAADVWEPEWSEQFEGKIVYVCHDVDTKGKHANMKVAAALRGHALRVVTLVLPFEFQENHGKDLTDYWLQGRTKQDFISLANDASVMAEPDEEAPIIPEVVGVNVMTSFDASLVGRPLRMRVTIVGKKSPSFIIPEIVNFDCQVNAGKKCESCSLEKHAGHMQVVIQPDDPVILRLINAPDEKVVTTIQKTVGIVKCPLFVSAIEQHRTVEEAYVRASIEDGPTFVNQDFTHRKIISSVSHDLDSNQSVVLTGTIRPNPKTQTNEFQAIG